MPKIKSYYIITLLLIYFALYTVQADEPRGMEQKTEISKVYLTPQQLERLRVARNAVKETLRGDFDKFGYEAMTFSNAAEAESMVVLAEDIAYTYLNYIAGRNLSFQQKMEVTEVLLKLSIGMTEKDILNSVRLEHIKADDVAEIVAIHSKKKQ